MFQVDRIPLEVGGVEGTNSAYVLPELDVVIDPGPLGASNWRRLCSGIEASGASVTAIDDVLVTHWHVDHAGLAPRLAREANATLWMHDHDAPLLASYASERGRRLEREARLLYQWGVPGDRIEQVRTADRPSALPDETPVKAVSDGDRVASLEVIGTPGHTLGHAAFGLENQVFVGDAVLGTYTPNVGGGDLRMDDPLGLYLDTLNRLEGIDGVGHPGHGTELDLQRRISEIRAHHRERTARTLDVLADESPATPWSIAVDLFGEMEGIHVKMGAGEAAAHLVRLAAEGSVKRVETDPDHYRPA